MQTAAVRPASGRNRRRFGGKVLVLLTCLLLGGMPDALRAQPYSSGVDSVPDVFNDQDVSGVVRLGKPRGLLGPYFDTDYFGPYLHVRHLGGDGPGYEDDGYTSFGLFVPKEFWKGMLFSEMHLSVDNLGNVLGSSGLGYRMFHEEWNRVFGTSFWYDGDGGHRGTFNQLALNVETRGENWDMFANVYVPFGDDEKRFARRVAPTGMQIGPLFRGNRLVINTPNLIVEEFEAAMRGLDVEIGGPLPVVGKWGVRGYGGWYHYQNDNIKDVNGGRFRLTADLTDSVRGQFVLNADNRFSTTVVLGVLWTLPGSGANRGPTRMPTGVVRSRAQVRGQSPDGGRPRRPATDGFTESQWHRMFQPVRRTDRVAVDTFVRQRTEDVFNLLKDPATGQPLFIVHVDSSAPAGGDGSFQQPFNNPRDAGNATSGNEIIVVHADSVFDDPANNFITLDPDQRLLGDGPGVVHTVDTQNFGTVQLPRANPDGTMLPRFEGAGQDAIVAASGTEISDFVLSNSQMSALSFGNDVTRAVTVNNVTIDGGMTGVDIQGSTAPITFTGTTIAGTTGTAFNVVGGASDITYNGDITNGSGRMVDIDGLQAGGSVIFQNGTLADNGGLGIRIMNSGANVAFEDVDITNFNSPGDFAVFLNNNTGTYTFSTLDIMTTNGGGLGAQDSGTVVVAGGNITANGGPAIDIDPTAVNLTFNNVTSTNSPTTGIRLDQVSGTLNITGLTRIDSSGAAGIDIRNSSVNATFANIDIDNTGAEGVLLMNNTGTFTGEAGSIDGAMGSSFRVDGGTPTVLYQGDINQPNNAAMVELANATGGSVTFDTGTLNATNGTGIQISGFDAPAMFNGTTTLNGGDAGIDILNDSDGTFTFSAATSITNPTGTAFNLINSGPTVTYNGTINQANAPAGAPSVVNISGLQGSGMVTFNGTVTGTNAAAGQSAVRIANSDGDVTFDTVDLNDATLPARGVELTNNTGIYTFDSLDVDTMNAEGIFANGGGRVDINGGSVTTTGESAIDMTDVTTRGISLTTVTAMNTMGNDGFRLDNVDGIDPLDVFSIGTLDVDTTGAGDGVFIDDSAARIDIDTLMVDNTGGRGVTIQDQAGTVDIDGGSITNTTGTAFEVLRGGADITYDGTITNTAGLTVDIRERTGGEVEFNGAVTANAGAMGINIEDATAVNTVDFNGTVDMGTGAGDRLAAGTAAVNIDNEGFDSTVEFFDLDIFTNGIEGLVVRDGGNINIGSAFFGGGDIDTTGAGATAITLDGTDALMNPSDINAGIFLDSITTDSLGAVANGIDITNVDGTFNVSGNTNMTTSVGTGIAIDGGDASYTFGDVTINGRNAAGIQIADLTVDSFGNPGSITFGDVSMGTPAGGMGAGIDISNVPHDVTFGMVTIADTQGSGILMDQVTGDIDLSSGGMITNVISGHGISITNSGSAMQPDVNISGYTVTFNAGNNGMAGPPAVPFVGINYDGGGAMLTINNNTVDLMGTTDNIGIQIIARADDVDLQNSTVPGNTVMNFGGLNTLSENFAEMGGNINGSIDVNGTVFNP